MFSSVVSLFTHIIATCTEQRLNKFLSLSCLCCASLLERVIKLVTICGRSTRLRDPSLRDQNLAGQDTLWPRLCCFRCSAFSPSIHLHLTPSRHTKTRDEEEDILEAICEHALENSGVFISRAKYIDNEKFLPSPSIRICMNAAFTAKEVEQIVDALCSAVESLWCSFIKLV